MKLFTKAIATALPALYANESKQPEQIPVEDVSNAAKAVQP